MQGEVGGSYSADYYNRIYITPTALALGNVVSTQVSTVRVWNAYLSPKTVIGLDGVDEGIEITPPAALPMVLSAMQETNWLVAVTPDGPAVLDAYVGWLFDGASTRPLHLTGNRIVPWGFAPNWSPPLRETLSWLTNILANNRGAEQRRSLRAAPRKGWQASFITEGAERALFDLSMAGWGRRVWALPVWVDVLQLDTALPAGSSAIACDTTGRDFRVGGLALLRGETAFDTEAVEILDMTAAGLTLKRVTQSTWPAGTRLYPLRSARLTEMPQTTRRTDALLQADCSFELTEPADWPAALPTTLYRGRPVFAQRPDESTDLSHSYERLTLLLDNTTGNAAVTDTAGKGFVLQQHRWCLAGRAEHSAWRSLLYALQGRAKSIWLPTHAQDLVPVEPLSGSLLKVQRVGYARFGVGQLGRQDIRIELADGSVLMRRITAAVARGPIEELVVDADFPGVIQPGQVARISYMALCRLASDDIELEHLTDQDGVARCAITLRGVRDDLEVA
ncbi:hypothetical protein [Comamonas kerstersii]|uniref:hypothetical protein n=1 Tax=Comamonas kerstersii TaxID=225992 RepID=UPI003F510673